VSGPRDPRHSRLEDKTVEVPLRQPAGTDLVPAEEPWWKNANQRVSPPPRMPVPPAPAMPAPSQVPRRDRPPSPALNRDAKAAPPRKRGHLALLIGVGILAIAAAVVLLIVALSGLDTLKGKVLNVSKAEAGVQRILLDPDDGYGATNVSDVVCNDGSDPEIRKGASFVCQVVVEGRKRQVLVVFSDDNGTYEVDRPR
jgi:hypothetical protein